MINDIYDHSTIIIDVAQVVLEHSRGLNNDQIEHVETIHRRAVDFITTFVQKQNLALDRFASYLNHDAMSPITVMIGYAEVLLLNMSGELTGPYRDAVQQICDSSYALRNEVKDIHMFVLELV